MAVPDTLQALWRGFADRRDLTALIGFSGDGVETWTFAELGEVAERAIRALVQRGIARGDCVALIAPNSPRWVGAFWGIVAAGATAVPLDAQNEDRELARMLALAGCRLALTTAMLAPRIAALAPSCRIVVIDDAPAREPAESWPHFLTSAAAVAPQVVPSDIAVVVFTSGTTGTPKAVPLTHANLMTNVRALAETRLVGPGDRALLPLPLYHAYPLTIGMITPLALGCAVVFSAGISGPELLAAMREGRVTALVGVPRLYTALLDSVRRAVAGLAAPLAALLRLFLACSTALARHRVFWFGRLLLLPLRKRVAPRLRLLVSGGAAVGADVEETLVACGWEMLTGYGLVETSSMLTFNPPGAALAGSAGRPVPGMELRIAAPDAAGIGDIETRGPSLFAGYRDDPAKTREAFTDDGWFRTGDLGSIDAVGYLHIAARKTETIVLADGKKLFPEPFEAIYARAPLVREIALLGHEGALVALVVPDLAAARAAGAMRLGEALREGLTAKAAGLPSYARLSGFAISDASLPRTQLGKIRRHLLPPLYQAAQEHKPAAAPQGLSAADRALVEGLPTAAIWQWLRQRYPDHDLRLDTIMQLDLGIDSLGWVELTLALDRDCGVALREKEIARIVTVRDLLHEAAAAQLAGTRVSAADPALLHERLGLALFGFRIIGEALTRVAMRWWFRLRVEGIERLPAAGPVLICPNHVSYLDPFAVGIALPRARLSHTYWGGWSGVAFNTRWRRLFSRAARVIPVDPDRAAGTGLALGKLALERGWNLVWFPEGARSADGTLQRFLPGIGFLVESNAVPIVPAYIRGSFAAWPIERRFPCRRPITVRFGSPLLPGDLSHDAPGRAREEKIAAAVQAAVAALAD